MKLSEQLAVIREARSRAYLDCVEGIRFAVRHGSTLDEALNQARGIAAINLVEATDTRLGRAGFNSTDEIRNTIAALTRRNIGA